MNLCSSAGYDEPAILSYAISLFCPTSADGLQRIASRPNLKKEIGLLARGLLAYDPRLWGGRDIACPDGITASAPYRKIASRTVTSRLHVSKLVAGKVEYEEANGR